MQRRQSNIAGALLAALGVLLLGAAPAAGSAGPVDRAFPGGSITQLAINYGPTEGSFANLAYQYESCEKAATEVSCTWRIDVGLAPEGAELCPSLADPLVWTSGEQSGNGAVASGPVNFALRGTPGQVLCVLLTYVSTREQPGWKSIAGGNVVLEMVVMGPELISPFEAIERKIINANTAALPSPPPDPAPFIVGPSCKTATLGSIFYVFTYRQMGCRKATNLARMARISGSSPSGYHCRSRNGSTRCWRQGHPKRYVEWRIPGTRSALNPS